MIQKRQHHVVILGTDTSQYGRQVVGRGYELSVDMLGITEYRIVVAGK